MNRRSGSITAVVIWAAAFIAVGIAWNGAASRQSIPEQIPYVISGGGAALVLSIIGAAVYIGAALRDRSPAE